MILVIHDINFAVNYSDHIVALKNGALRFHGPAQGRRTETRMADLYELGFRDHAQPAWLFLQLLHIQEDHHDRCAGNSAFCCRRGGFVPAPGMAHAYEPVSIRHKLGTTLIKRLPQACGGAGDERGGLRSAWRARQEWQADYVSHFLAKYKGDAKVQDLGAIVQPNLERVHALRPDLILMTSLQAGKYEESAEIAPPRTTR